MTACYFHDTLGYVIHINGINFCEAYFYGAQKLKLSGLTCLLKENYKSKLYK
jgi:hypothetical protein